MGYFKIYLVRMSARIGCVAIIHLLLILSLQRNGLWKDGIALWTDTVHKSPNKARPYFGLGTAYKEKGYTDRAIENYETAIRLKPDYVDAYNNMGLDLLAKGETERAVHCFEKAVLLKPLRADSYYNLGLAMSYKGMYKEAIYYFETALRLMPEYKEALYGIAIVYLSLNQPEKAEAYLRAYREGE